MNLLWTAVLTVISVGGGTVLCFWLMGLRGNRGLCGCLHTLLL